MPPRQVDPHEHRGLELGLSIRFMTSSNRTAAVEIYDFTHPGLGVTFGVRLTGRVTIERGGSIRCFFWLKGTAFIRLVHC